MPAKLKILFLGDVVGALGRQGLKQIIPLWRKKYHPDLIVANIENLAHGKGVTSKTLEDIKSAGIDIFTGGNHIWKKESLEVFPDLKIATPNNDSRTLPQHRYQQTTVKDTKVSVANLLGQTSMDGSEYTSNPFLAADKIIDEIKDGIIIIDFHAELTSEKVALGHYLDGRVTAIIGTHTHVPTADAQILPQGTAYITDVGMVGPYPSVLGIKKEIIIEKFLTGEPIRHELPESGQIEINAVLLEMDRDTKQSTKIQHLREIIS